MRIRTIKPEFFVDEELAALDPLDRLTFIGLWCAADKAGRLEDRPTRLAIQVLPYDRGDFGKRLDRLVEARFLVRYQTEDGRRFIQVRTWERHQKPHHTEAESTIPAWNGADTVQTPLGNGENTVKERTEGKGKEGKGEEKEARARTVFSAPSETEWLSYVRAKWPDWPASDALAAHGYYESRRWTGVKDWRGCAKSCYHRWDCKNGNGKRPADQASDLLPASEWGKNRPDKGAL